VGQTESSGQSTSKKAKDVQCQEHAEAMCQARTMNAETRALPAAAAAASLRFDPAPEALRSAMLRDFRTSLLSNLHATTVADQGGRMVGSIVFLEKTLSSPPTCDDYSLE